MAVGNLLNKFIAVSMQPVHKNIDFSVSLHFCGDQDEDLEFERVHPWYVWNNKCNRHICAQFSSSIETDYVDMNKPN